DEISACADYLMRQIALINPRILVTLGRISMSRFFPGATITKVHGQVKNIGFGRVAMAMFHPAAALRDPSRMRDFEQDFERLPGLMARALAANEAALRGEALPAGVPHPGDADYVDDIAVPGATQQDAEAAASGGASNPGPLEQGEATGTRLPADAGTVEGKAPAEGTQLSLF
ncbi:MAG: uracil-DNA glycosylase family protein, partial [Caldilineaceae bacterium]